MEWAKWFEDGDNSRVKLTRVGPYFVSTVFLGLDSFSFFFGEGPPILFETMVYTDQKIPSVLFDRDVSDFLDEQERCATWLEAEVQHQAMIDKLREAHDDVEQLEPKPLAADPEESHA